MKGLGGLVLLLLFLWALKPRPGAAETQFKVGDMVRIDPGAGIPGFGVDDIYIIIEMVNPDVARIAHSLDPAQTPLSTIGTEYLLKV